MSTIIFILLELWLPRTIYTVHVLALEHATLVLVACIDLNSEFVQSVPNWQWGGDGTRDSLAQKKWLQSQGFKFVNGVAEQACGFQ